MVNSHVWCRVAISPTQVAVYQASTRSWTMRWPKPSRNDRPDRRWTTCICSSATWIASTLILLPMGPWIPHRWSRLWICHRWSRLYLTDEDSENILSMKNIFFSLFSFIGIIHKFTMVEILLDCMSTCLSGRGRQWNIQRKKSSRTYNITNSISRESPNTFCASHVCQQIYSNDEVSVQLWQANAN